MDSNEENKFQLEYGRSSWESSIFTCGEKAGLGGCLIGFGIAAGLLAAFIASIGVIAVIQIVLIPGAIISVIAGLYQLAAASGTSEYSIKCPKCETETKIMAGIDTRPCPKCHTPIQILGTADSTATLSSCTIACPFCASEINCSGLEGTTSCPSCGSTISVKCSDGSGSLFGESVETCGCGHALPSGAFVCATCGRIAHTEPIIEMKDGQVYSLSPFGHLARANGLLQAITDILEKAPSEELDVPQRDTLEAVPDQGLDVPRIKKIIEIFKKALLSLEVAADSSVYAAASAQTLKSLNLQYAAMLVHIHKILATQKRWRFSPGNEIELPYDVQHAVWDRLQKNAPGEKIHKWTPQIIEYEIKCQGGGSTGTVSAYVIKDYSKVYKEAETIASFGQ